MKYNRRQNHGRRYLPYIIILLLVIGGIGFWRYNQAELSNVPRQKMQRLVKTISSFMFLPTDEEPTLAEVSDVTKLPKQPFYSRAQNGDQVLLYSKNRLAILYRPSAKKIVTMGPIDGEVAFTKFSAAIRNGTDNILLLDSVSEVLKASFPNVNIVEKAAASRADFPSTIVIPTSEDKQDLAAQVAAGIGAQVGVMPINESAASSDLIIVLGRNYGQDSN